MIYTDCSETPSQAKPGLQGRSQTTKARSSDFAHKRPSRLELGGGRETDTLVDARFQILDGLFQERSLGLVNLADRVELGDPLLSELDVDAKVGEVLADLLLDRFGRRRVGLEVDVRRGDESGLSLEGGSHDLVGKLGTGLSHGQGGGSGTRLGLDDLVTTELDSVDKSVTLRLVLEDGRGDRGLGLRQEGQDGVSGVSSDDGDDVVEASVGSPTTLATKVEARKQSKVVTPKSRLGSKTPFFFRTSAKTGTVELTGFEMTRMKALGQASAIDSARVAQIPALMLKRSSRVIPGFLGTPAGMTTISAPLSALTAPRFSSSGPL